MKKLVLAFAAASLSALAIISANAGPYEDGIAALNNMQDENAFKILKPLADRGHAKAQNTIGFMYSMAIGVEGSKVKATEYYRKAAEQGNIKAQANLARQYRMGNGVAQSNELAAKWYQKAADQGDAQSAKLLKEIKSDKLPLGFSLYGNKDDKSAPKTKPKINTRNANSGPTFPAFHDSKLNAIGDAAASCMILMMEKALSSKMAPFMESKNRENFKAADKSSVEFAGAFIIVNGVFEDPKFNGGIEGGLAGKRLPDILGQHRIKKDNGKAGPSEYQCVYEFRNFVLAKIKYDNE